MKECKYYKELKNNKVQCTLCPNFCVIKNNEVGRCKTRKNVNGKLVSLVYGKPVSARADPLTKKPIYHMLPGTNSFSIGTAGCTMRCVYCQNWEISQLRQGREVGPEELANMMISLQNLGCHNINFVSPTIWIPQILKSLPLAIKKGLNIPLVYNTGGYDAVSTLKLLDGIFDIYMPDIKYSDSKIAKKYSLVPDYWEIIQKAVQEMHRQVGDLVVDKKGIAQKGLLIRHLVLPEGLAGTEKVVKFISTLSKNSYVNLMAQYYPVHKASRYPEINRRIFPEEFQEAIEQAKKAGLRRFD